MRRSAKACFQNHKCQLCVAPQRRFRGYTRGVAFTLTADSISQRQGALQQGPVLFENVSFSWSSPGLHVIMGPSGAGKSSLLKTIGGVWKARTGTVKANGKNLWSASGSQNLSVIGNMGFAFQNNALFSSLRVIANVTFPHRQRFPLMNEKERSGLAMDWLQKVGLENSAFQFPHELSGGMQKRLSIARTLVLRPEYIFLDDPTAGLDPITSKKMADLVMSLLSGSESLVIIVTNDPDRARDWGPNIHYLFDKKLISPGVDSYKGIAETYA